MFNKVPFFKHIFAAYSIFIVKPSFKNLLFFYGTTCDTAYFGF